MSDLSLILLAAGSSSRFGMPVKKQWLRLDKEPLWLYVVNAFLKFHNFKEVIIVGAKEDVAYMQLFTDHTVVQGGSERQYSIQNALKHVTSSHVMISDVARCCLNKEVIDTLISNKEQADCIVPAIGLHDTVVYENETINRDNILRIQTPQLSKTSVLQKALTQENLFTDESSAIVSIGGTRHFIQGDNNTLKLTKLLDLKELTCTKKPSSLQFVGNGFDVHRFQAGKEMALGGVAVHSPLGFEAHSDGDVALHALIDALLGAVGAGDIGELFPDTDPAFKNADSKLLLEQVVTWLKGVGYEIINVDLTIMAQQPKLKHYKTPMRKSIASILGIDPVYVNIKATTTEKLGFVGRSEGVGVISTANLKLFDWTNL